MQGGCCESARKGDYNCPREVPALSLPPSRTSLRRVKVYEMNDGHRSPKSMETQVVLVLRSRGLWASPGWPQVGTAVPLF